MTKSTGGRILIGPTLIEQEPLNDDTDINISYAQRCISTAVGGVVLPAGQLVF